MCSQVNQGKMAEQAVLAYLHQQGYRIIASNYKTKLSEIDILACFEDSLVAIEVKSSWSAKAFPEVKVDMQKRQKIYQSLQFFLYQKKQWRNYPVALEVIAILMPEKKIRHYKEEFFDF